MKNKNKQTKLIYHALCFQFWTSAQLQNSYMFVYFPTNTLFRKSDVVWIFSCSFSATTLGLKTEICGRKQLGKQDKKKVLVCKCISPNLKTKRKKDSCFYLILSNLKKWCKKLVILGPFLKKTERGHDEFNHFWSRNIQK